MEVEFTRDLIVNKIDFEVKIQIYDQRSITYVNRGIISFFHDFVSLFLRRFLSNKGQIFPPESYKSKDLRPFYYLAVVKSTLTINSSHAQLFQAYFQIPVSTRRGTNNIKNMLYLPSCKERKTVAKFRFHHLKWPTNVERAVFNSCVRNIRWSSQKKQIFVEQLSGTFSPRSGTFSPFYARPRAIALGSSPPPLIRIARVGLGTRLAILISSLPLTRSNSTKDWEWVELESIDRPLSVVQTLCCWMISLKNNHVIKSSTYTTGHILSCRYVSYYVCEFWIDVLLCKLQTFSKTYTIATHLNTSLMKMKFIFWGIEWIYFESTHYFHWFSGLYNWIRPIGTIKSLNIPQIRVQYLIVKYVIIARASCEE